LTERRANERVIVATSRARVEIPWQSRQQLLDEIRHLDSAEAIVDAFEAVGTSRPVTLTDHDRALLYGLLNRWADRVPYGELPEGIWPLRCAIADDLHDEPAE
jgi:hypothetical protein